MIDENEYLLLSGLQHFSYCQRQWALIHIEGNWLENQYTVEGRYLHERADSNEVEYRGGVKTVRGLALRSTSLGLVGRADVVEFRVNENGEEEVFPIEYKRGRPKKIHCDEIQLCGQALCLEEMLGVELTEGAIFYGKTRRRKTVVFNIELRTETKKLAFEMREMFEQKKTPPAIYEEGKCRSCSLYSQCLPLSAGVSSNSNDYLNQVFSELEGPF